MASEVKMNVPPRKGSAARWRSEPPRSKAAASASKAGTGRSMEPPTSETCEGRQRLRYRHRAGDVSSRLAAGDGGPAGWVQVTPSPNRAGPLPQVLLSTPLAGCAGGQQEAHNRAHGQDGAQDDVTVPVVMAADAFDDFHRSPSFFLLSVPVVMAMDAFD